MKKVMRNEILDYVTYAEQRDGLLESILAIKAIRRIHVGDYLTFLFENPDTIRYQIQEMVRVERMVRETDIEHELATYNEVLGSDGELGCTLLIEIDDPQTRDVKLREWLGLEAHIYVKVEDGSRIYATYDERQVGEDRLSSVQYLKFVVGAGYPVAVGVDLPAFTAETVLTAEQAQALRNDLSA
jgi:TusA-related sulfurtransferase